MPYVNMGLSSAIIKFENSYKNYRDPNWKKNITFIKLSNLDFSQKKPYATDGMNNKANNTLPSIDGNTVFPEMISYWNIYQNDEKIVSKWIFFTYIDNLSFLGGLLDIFLLIPSFLMIGYTFRLNEINVFFYQQLMKKGNAL